jgi:hypothetical protein
MASAPYQHPYKHYAALYGCSLRTIARYAKAGLPLDDEEATRICMANQRTGATPLALNRAVLPDGPRLESNRGLGLSASIERLQEAEAAAHAEYAAALQGNDQNLAANKLKSWTVLAEQLRKTAQTSPEVEEANKQAISLSDLQSTLNELFIKLRQDLDTLPRRIALELVGKDELSVREILTREVNEIISSLYLCKYLKGGDG